MATQIFRTAPLIAPAQPRLPAAPVEYSQRYGDDLTNILRLYFSQLQNFNQVFTTNTGGGLLQFPNGSWYQADGSQTVGQIDKAIPIYSTNSVTENGIVLEDSVATFTGSRSGTTLTVSGHTGAPIALNMTVIGAGFEGATFTGHIDNGTLGEPGAVLTVTSVASGTITTGMYIAGTGVAHMTQVVLGGTGTGGVGTYNLSNVIKQTVPAGTAMTGYAEKIVSYGTGTGGDGTYVMGTSGTVASTACTARAKDRLVFEVSGYYNIQFSAQVSKSTASTGFIWIWPRINGVDIPDSNSKWAVQGTSAEVVAALNFVLPVFAGDYFQLMFAANSTNVTLLREAPNAFSPAIPSVLLTATFVSALFT
jgi:hypothetical protein